MDASFQPDGWADVAAPAPDIPAVGSTINGRFRLLRALGRGGMGLVYEAEHLRLRLRVAIKFPHPDVLALPDALARFEREARASARLRGPHFVRVLDVDTDAEARPYMVMDLVSGRTLDAELKARGKLPIHEAVGYALEACDALAEAHALGVVHRDLKPANLLLADEGRGRVLKILDFGVSKIEREGDPLVTAATITLGTPLYMAPEQLRSSRDVDGRADIWALGVILFELLAGAPPFSGTTTAAVAAIVADAAPSIRELRPEVPERLERVLIKALAKSRDERYASAELFAAALRPFASTGSAAHRFRTPPPGGGSEQRSSRSPRISPPALRLFLSTVAIGMMVGALLTRRVARAWPDDAIRNAPMVTAIESAAGGSAVRPEHP